MDRERAEAQVLARLDSAIAREFATSDRAVVAFSGGLGSLVIAAIARKRGDLRCVVVGTRGAADVGAALIARDFLDLRVEILTPHPSLILRTARALRAADPTLLAGDVLDLVPLALVEARHPGEVVLTGFGLVPRSPTLRRHLAKRASRSPAPSPSTATAAVRRLALRLAGDLAVPEGFSKAARRSPAEGSGIGPAIRAVGHARHQSVPRLLAGGV
jgi:hypothetical protein